MKKLIKGILVTLLLIGAFFIGLGIAGLTVIIALW